jgi:acyl-CoA synthetase (AMP-forming)/AMP-acid ligase II
MTPATHLAAVWRALAAQHADRPALIDAHGRWSYRDLHGRIVRLGNALNRLGLKKGERVALLAPDLREYLEADYATMAAGFVRVPLDPRLTRTDVAAMLRYAEASALIVHV